MTSDSVPIRNITAFGILNNLLQWKRLEPTAEGLCRHVQVYRCTSFIAYRMNRFISYRASDLYSESNSRLVIIQEMLNHLSLNTQFEPLKNSFGIYFLYNSDDMLSNKTDIPIYIGQTSGQASNKSMARLVQHVTSRARDTDSKYYDKWDTALYVTSTSDDRWNAAIISDLERYFIKAFKDKSSVYTTYKTQRDGQAGTDLSISDIHKVYATELVAISNLLSHPDIDHPIELSNKLKDLFDKSDDTFKNTTSEEATAIKQTTSQLKTIYDTDFGFEKRRDMYCRIKQISGAGDGYQLQSNRILIRGEPSRELCTPSDIAAQLVSQIPADKFTSTSKFFDPACKSGSFLIAIIDRLMSDDPSLPINQERAYKNKIRRLDNILRNQIYASCCVGESWFITNKILLDHIEKLYNSYDRTSVDVEFIIPKILCIPGYEYIVKHSNSQITADLLNTEFGEDLDMKFDVIIGNPPYNNDLYVPFCINAKYSLNANGIVKFIIPAKWQSKMNAQSTQFVDEILPFISDIEYYKKASELFEIAMLGGISVITYDNNKHTNKTFKCYSNGSKYFERTGPFRYQIDATNVDISILNKVLSKNEPTFYAHTPKFINERVTATYNGSSNMSESILKKIELKGSGVVFRSTKHRFEIDPTYVTKPEHLDKYHLIHSCWMDRKSRFGILNPNEVTLKSNALLYRASTISEIESVLSYLRCKLIWFLIIRFHNGEYSMQRAWSLSRRYRTKRPSTPTRSYTPITA